jgi:gamma-glutamylcyclotransferase (GGCT)/AIG2-like uncharacterized protein YtfP
VNCQLLFVYGTLRRGFSRHKFLKAARAQFLSLGTVHGELYDLGDYPGAEPSPHPRALITGEIYRLPHAEQALQVLDEVEGVRASSPGSGEYRRDSVRVTLRNGQMVDAWIYWLNRRHGWKRTIPSGDYKKVLKLD